MTYMPGECGQIVPMYVYDTFESLFLNEMVDRTDGSCWFVVLRSGPKYRQFPEEPVVFMDEDGNFVYDGTKYNPIYLTVLKDDMAKKYCQ